MKLKEFTERLHTAAQRSADVAAVSIDAGVIEMPHSVNEAVAAIEQNLKYLTAWVNIQVKLEKGEKL